MVRRPGPGPRAWPMKPSRDGKEWSTPEKGFQVLAAVSEAAASDRVLEEILRFAVFMAAQALGCKICSVMLLDKSSGMLSVVATQSTSDAYRRKPAIRLAQSLSSRTVYQKKPLMVRDVRTDTRYGFPAIAASEGMVSLLSVPMIFRGDVIGVINSYTDRERDFTSEEVSLLQAVANQCACTVASARLLLEKASAEEALAARKVVDQAKALLMKTRGFSEPQAHRKLQELSMSQCKPVKRIAEAIVLAGDLAVDQLGRQVEPS
jgi:GAF domain-containing protein